MSNEFRSDSFDNNLISKRKIQLMLRWQSRKSFFLEHEPFCSFFIEHEQSVQDMFSSTRCSSTSHPNVRVPNDPGDDDYQCYG